MASKRDLDEVDDGEVSDHEPKRAKKHGGKKRQHQNSGTDPTWGQKYVFSNFDDATTIPIGEESDFEDDADALAYLKSVRLEANGIPHLLVAPRIQIGPQLPTDFHSDGDVKYKEDEEDVVDRSIYTNGIGDSRGYYDDGAYIAAPEDDEEGKSEEGEISGEENPEWSRRALHEAYFSTVLGQYEHLRAVLSSTPPPGAPKRLSSSQPTYAGAFGRNSHTIATWARILRNTDPNPLQVALLSKDSVIRILRVLLGGKFLRRGYPLPERTSRWIWALLARLPERGQLNHTEIGWIRDLGRRAVLMGRSLTEMAALREELQDGGLGVNEGVDASSSDEDVVAEVETEEFEGAKSPDDQIDVAASDSDVAPDLVNIKSDAEEGEVDEESEDVAMDLASDSDADASEAPNGEQDLQDAKARLLAQIDSAAAASASKAAEDEARERSRMNLRATLNMILTVAGECYGQRDLLEFREPFVGM